MYCDEHKEGKTIFVKFTVLLTCDEHRIFRMMIDEVHSIRTVAGSKRYVCIVTPLKYILINEEFNQNK
jgi:hypothetical protein